MNIEAILSSKRLVLKPTTKWTAIDDPRPAFKKAFGTTRFGKLRGTHMYVTLGLIKSECEHLIAARALPLHHLRSTDGSGRTYPGFDTGEVASRELEELVNAFLSAVDQHVQSSTSRSTT